MVYIANQDTLDVDELCSVPLAGGAVTKLNPSLPTGRAVAGLAIAPDNSRVVYLADQRFNDVQELFVGDPCLLCDGFEAGDSGRWD